MKRTIFKPTIDDGAAVEVQNTLSPKDKRTQHSHSFPLSFTSSTLARLLVIIALGFVIIAVGILYWHIIDIESKYSVIDNGLGNPITHSQKQPFQNQVETELQRQIEEIKGRNAYGMRASSGKNVSKQSSSSSYLSPQKKIMQIDSKSKIVRNVHSLANDSSEQIPGRGSGSKRGHIQCDVNVSPLVSYWNDPRSDADRTFRSPFHDIPSPEKSATESATTRYLSFEPDCGGWNNIRMEFEIMVVFAAATGRTLILPPDHPFYLLSKDKVVRHRGLQNFFQYIEGKTTTDEDSGGFDDVVNTISTQDFFQNEILEKKSYPLPTDETNLTKVLASLKKCDMRAKSPMSCIYLYEYLSNVADFVPDWMGESEFHEKARNSTILR